MPFNNIAIVAPVRIAKTTMQQDVKVSEYMRPDQPPSHLGQYAKTCLYSRDGTVSLPSTTEKVISLLEKIRNEYKEINVTVISELPSYAQYHSFELLVISERCRNNKMEVEIVLCSE